MSVFKLCLCFPSDPICDHYVAFTFQQGLVGHFNTLKNNLDPSITRPFKPCVTLHLFNVFRSREFIDIRPLPDCLLSRHCLVQPIRTTHRSSCELNFLFLPHETVRRTDHRLIFLLLVEVLIRRKFSTFNAHHFDRSSLSKIINSVSIFSTTAIVISRSNRRKVVDSLRSLFDHRICRFSQGKT